MANFMGSMFGGRAPFARPQQPQRQFGAGPQRQLPPSFTGAQARPAMPGGNMLAKPAPRPSPFGGMGGRGGGGGGIMGGAMGQARGMGGGGSPGGGMFGAAGGAARGMAPAPAPRPGGLAGMMGGVRSGMGGGQPPKPQPQAQPGMAGMAGRMAGLLSDERSKEKIRELEGVRERYEALLDTPSSTAESFRGVSAKEFEYKDPEAPGAAPGKQEGPMAHELRPLGVTQIGPDGMERVDTDRLSLKNASAQGETSRELSALRERLAMLEDDPDAVLEEAGGRRR